MEKNRLRCIAVKNMLVFVIYIVFGIEYMAKQFFAKFFQQKIFGFKVSVECSPAYGRVKESKLTRKKLL